MVYVKEKEVSNLEVQDDEIIKVTVVQRSRSVSRCDEYSR